VTPNVDHFIVSTMIRGFANSMPPPTTFCWTAVLEYLRRVAGQPHLRFVPAAILPRHLSALQAATDRVVVVGGSDRQIAALRERFALIIWRITVRPWALLNNSNASRTASHSSKRRARIGSVCCTRLAEQEILARQLQARGIARGLTLCIAHRLTSSRASSGARRGGCSVAEIEWRSTCAKSATDGEALFAARPADVLAAAQNQIRAGKSRSIPT